MKVRIHQVAKDLNRPTKDVLVALEKLGVEGKTHTSSIEEEWIPKIRKELKMESGAGSAEVLRAAAPKSPASAPVAAAPEPAHKRAPAAHPHKKPARETHVKPEAGEQSPQFSQPPAAEQHIATEAGVPALTEEELERLTAPASQPAAAPVVPEPVTAPAPAAPAQKRPKIQVSENVPIKDFAQKLGVMSKVLLKKLLDRGILANINQNIDLKLAEQLANEFGYDVEVTSYEEVVAHEQEAEESAATRVIRPPVVTIMGHVDHGKTSLLDAIRESNIAGGESGGITQHIGAYQVKVGQRAITFIDTPGHEAFTHMRARGAHVTDIVILVVAADDGVMPQTLEAMDHARAAKVPIVVAINKIDKPDANPERIKRQLSQHDLLIEEYGGDTVAVEISARRRTNIDTLLEMVLLVADLLELRSSPNRQATGTILEARLDKSRGPLATVLVQNGTLHVSDVFVAGAVMGKVRAMFDDHGEKMREATPGTPVEVLGFQGVPQAGDSFQVFKDEFKARSIVAFRQTKAREMQTQTASRLSLDQLFSKIQQGEIRELPIIIKADVQGSVEVLKDSLTKLGTEEVKIRVIHSGTGAITLSDVLLASASNAIIIGYNVRPEPKARELAEKEKVDIRAHTIIYNIVSEIKSALEGLLRPTLKEVFLGSAEVRDTFRIPKVGTIAGCYVVSGKINRNAPVRLVRDNVVIYEGKISSLKRFKEDASEVREGFECGVGLENYNDVKVGDYIEAYTIEKIARQLV
jgi:translation initiation factor IF-2